MEVEPQIFCYYCEQEKDQQTTLEFNIFFGTDTLASPMFVNHFSTKNEVSCGFLSVIMEIFI